MGSQSRRLAEIFELHLLVEYKSIYGADIDLSQNTPDGQKRWY